MGLDFTLYKKPKGVSFYGDFSSSMTYDELTNKYELAYGRKSWELVNMLATAKEVNEGEGILKRDCWVKLMGAMEPIGNKLYQIAEAYDHEVNAPEDYPEFIFTEDDKRLIAEYEYWHNKTFDNSPQLGYDFSVGYMLSFWEAKDKVFDVLDDPDYEVYMSISY